MKEKKARAHSELIKQWADDDSLVIQYKRPSGKWLDVDPNWSDICEYRIKPEVILYRVALFSNTHENWCQACTNNKSHDYYEQSDTFRKWLTDWIEVELDEVEI